MIWCSEPRAGLVQPHLPNLRICSCFIHRLTNVSISSWTLDLGPWAWCRQVAELGGRVGASIEAKMEISGQQSSFLSLMSLIHAAMAPQIHVRREITNNTIHDSNGRMLSFLGTALRQTLSEPGSAQEGPGPQVPAFETWQESAGCAHGADHQTRYVSTVTISCSVGEGRPSWGGCRGKLYTLRVSDHNLCASDLVFCRNLVTTTQ
jgi:hypothetical protein